MPEWTCGEVRKRSRVKGVFPIVESRVRLVNSAETCPEETIWPAGAAFVTGTDRKGIYAGPLCKDPLHPAPFSVLLFVKYVVSAFIGYSQFSADQNSVAEFQFS